MIRYALTIFLSAFLLFQVQPMIAKFILPWFGGTSSVWTTCMLFFQVALLLGYCYSHFVTKRLSPKRQWILHAILLCVALVFLPVQPSDVWKPSGTEDPTWQMLLLLGATIGFPFFLLSTTGPLIQAWQSKTHSDKSAYRLFAVSNFGSLLGLLGYPFLVEPYLRLGDQSLYWSIGFGMFAVMSLWSGWQLFSVSSESDTSADVGDETGGGSLAGSALEDSPESTTALPQPGFINCVVWTLLAFAASAMLLATTNQMCQEVASVPFLWVLPLGLYLITFIICFENPRWYRRWFFFPLMFCSVLLAIGLLNEGILIPLPLQVAGYAIVMFACCMTCHGELAKCKPAESNLTLFYLMVSVGGALGGIFVVVVAPRIFDAYFEFQVSLILSVGLSVLAMLVYPDKKSSLKGLDSSEGAKRSSRSWKSSCARGCVWLSVPMAIVAIGATVDNIYKESLELNEPEVLFRTRNSYGTLHVRAYFDDDGQEQSRSLINGRIKHGAQSGYSWLKDIPSSYYSPTSGIGVAVDQLSELKGEGSLKFGVVGLGTGTMASWGIAGDSFKFYEINPEVERVAREYFSYLGVEDLVNDRSGDTDASDRLNETVADDRTLEFLQLPQIEVVIGDARIQMDKYYAKHGSEEFDLLVVDAFSSDAIPMHLLTRECFKMYCDNISDRGILAIHVSNRYLDLGTIVYNLAEELDHSAILIETDEDSEDEKMQEDFENGADESSWVLVMRDPELIKRIMNDADWSIWEQPMPTTVWTDDFGSLTDVLDWSDSTDFAEDKWDELLEYFSSDEEDELETSVREE